MRAWKLTMDTSMIGELFLLLFKSRRTFYVTLQNMMRLSIVLQTFCEHQVTWLPKKFNNLVIIKNNTMLFSSFYVIMNE